MLSAVVVALVEVLFVDKRSVKIAVAPRRSVEKRLVLVALVEVLVSMERFETVDEAALARMPPASVERPVVVKVCEPRSTAEAAPVYGT